MSIGIVKLRDNFVKEQLYDIEVSGGYGCLDERFLICNTEGNNIRANIDSTILHISQKFSDDFYSNAKDIKIKTNDNVKNSATEIRLVLFEAESPIFPQNIRHIFKIPRCSRFYHWITKTGNCVRKKLFVPINNAYEKQRHLLQMEVNKLLTDAQDDVDVTGDKLVDQTSQLVNRHVRQWEENTLNANSGVFTCYSYCLQFSYWACYS